MKILIIGPLTSGGRERRMAQLIVGLNNYPQCEVTLLVPNEKIDYREVLKTKAHIEMMTAEQRNNINATVEKILTDFKADIVHLWIEEIHWFKAIQKLRYKYRFKYIAGFVASGLPVPFLSSFHISYLIGYWRADAVVSNSAAGLIARRAPKRNTYVIPNGFSFDRFDYSMDRNAKRQELGIGNSIAIVMVARFEVGKDWDLFLEMAKRAKLRKYDTRFLAVGTGTLYNEFVNKAKNQDLDNIIFLGRRSDVEQILLACDVSVLFNNPKHLEGISNSLVESMAAELPVIATGTGGTPELVMHEKTGFLVAECDADTAFKYLTHLYSDNELRRRMGKAAKEYVKQNLSLDLMTERYIKLYKSLISNK